MTQFLSILTAALLLAAGVVRAQPRSGLPVGAKVPPYEIIDPERGEPAEYLLPVGDAPGMVLFVRPDAPHRDALLALVERLASQHNARLPGFRAMVVIQAGPAVVPQAEALVRAKGLTVPLFYLPTGRPPKPFKIHPEAQSTLMVYRDGKVTANFVDVTPGDFKALEEAVGAAVR